MKTFSLLLASIGLSMTCFAQKPTIKWGEEFKLRKGSSDLEVISVDKSGAYLQESHQALKSYFVVGASMRESASLVKVDKNLTEVFRNDFNKELRGKEFEQFFPFEDKLFLISSDYSRRDKTKAVYASAVNKSTGELTGEFKEVAIFQKEEKKDDIDFKITYNADSTKIILVSSIKGKERNEYTVQEFDKNFKKIGKPVVLTNEFEAKKYQLQDLLYLGNNKILLVGRVYEYEEGKRKKAKFLDFTNYNIRLYDEKGKQQAEINTTVNGKWLNSTKVVQEKNNDLVLAAFYSNTKKGKTIDGLLVQRININDGTVLSTSDKAINNSLLTADNDDDDDKDDDKDDDDKEERKERERLNKLKDEGEGFSKYMQFRNIFYTPDNGLVILAEQYKEYVTVSHSTSSAGAGAGAIMGGGSTTTTYHYNSGDLMMCKIDAGGNIGWLEILPKDQREVISMTGSSSGMGMGFGGLGLGLSYSYTGYFDEGNRPFYSGFGAMQTDGNIQVIFNDSPKNIGVTQAGQKAKRINRYAKSDCYVLNIDAVSGKLGRKQFFSNTDVPTAMPRLGSIINNEMYLVGKTDRMFGKTKIAIAKITVK
ncbi:hypothetical protein [Chitinophaga filiformis]|uniref:Uncharacterized protein n=1 Tax=Chitinophaga filiformis TaxID=104663 RepID=A0A1G7VKT6_CHIFI|nr:hypothetical protein [Chitinophaga filiformis]SDG60415.1 hypothetical protein SAMN04488121_105163 [Chitinophaga filiformis]